MIKKIAFVFLFIGLIIIPQASLVCDETTEEDSPLWVWGDVLSIDKENQRFLLNFYNYDTAETAELTIYVDDKTVYEGVDSLDEVEADDILNVDYIVGRGGKLIATRVVLEQLEKQ